jgi:hypothetical protein
MLKPTLPEKGISCNHYPDDLSLCSASSSRSNPVSASSEERYDEQNQEDEKQNFGDSGGCADQAAEAEDSRDDSDY